jgi:membrane fusion protein (multidrug efflux system)
MMLRNKKSLSVVLAIVLLLTGIIGYRIYANIAGNKSRADMAKGKAVAVQTSLVGRRDIAPQMEFAASLEPAWTADVSAKVAGRINDLPVNEGDYVKAGSVLASLDTSELNAQVVQAQGNLAQAESSLEQADSDYSRYNTLAGQGAVSAQMMDGYRTKKGLAQGQVQAAQGALNLVQEKLNEGSVIAPRDGVVTKRFVQSGTYTNAGAAIVTVADVSNLLAKATVGEAQVSSIAVGTDVKVKLDALNGQEFAGTVTRISPTATLPSRTFTAEITIPNDASVLKAGMFAKVEIPTQIHQSALVIPGSALVMRDDQATVFVVGSDNKVQQKVLTLGYVGNGWAEILDGLAEGDNIVVDGQNKIKDGVAVEPTKDGDN